MKRKTDPAPFLFGLLIISVIGVAAILVTLIMREYFRQTTNVSETQSAEIQYSIPVSSPVDALVTNHFAEPQDYISPEVDFSNQAIQLIWFYKPPSDGYLDPLVNSFDYFILTKVDEPVRDEIKQLGSQATFLQYLRIEAIQDPGDCETQPNRNQVADQVGDYCRISEQHPDWFLLDENGQRMVGGDGYVIMDPGNLEWRQFWLERTIVSQEELGWDGVFLDNLEGGIHRRRRFEQMPAKYPTEEEYVSAVLGFIEYIYTGYFVPQGRPLMANIVYFEDKYWYTALQYLDGAMKENWAVSHSGKYRDPEEWETDLRRAEQTQAMGKYAILVSQGDQHDYDRQQFAFASSLLITYGKTYFRYTNGDVYDATWLYPNYNIELGKPLGARYYEDGLWRRDFTKGYVTVDPVNHIGNIFIP